MPFIPENFITDSSANTNAARIHRYREDITTITTMKSAGYFDNAVNGSTGGGYGLRDGDVILADASDGMSFLKMTVNSNGNATVESANDFT